MDTNLRSLLAAAQQLGGGAGAGCLQQAYGLMRNVAESKPAIDVPEPFGQDLFVLCAEIAYQHGQREMVRECLKMYFMKTPPTNQFLCRAYLCQAQLLAPKTAENSEQLDKAVVYLIKAINMAKDNPRYHFLVYNASVLYWQFCRPFLKPQYRQYLARSLHQVVKALDDIDDKDYEWRAQLMIALIECHMDAARKNDASHIATAAAAFIKQHVPSLYKTVFGLMVRHQLIETAKLQKDLRQSSELYVYYRICRLKLSLDNKDQDKDVQDEMQRIINTMMGKTEPALDKQKSEMGKGSRTSRGAASPDGGDTSRRASFPSERSSCILPRRVSVPSAFQPSQSKISNISSTAVMAGLNNVSELDVEGPPQELSSRKQLVSDSMEDCAEAEKVIACHSPSRLASSHFKIGAGQNSGISGRSPSRQVTRATRTPSPPGIRKFPMDSAEKPYLLLELGRLALEQDLASITQQCCDLIKNCVGKVKDQSFFLEVEFLQCDLLVRTLGHKQESYTKAVIDLRLQAIKRCDEAVVNAVRLGSPRVLQAGCVTQWNLCLPLLQPNLRQHVRRPLNAVAEALENAHSLLIQLRCQVHMEAAKCEEDQEQIASAITHLKKALDLDDGSVYQERLQVALHRLELRAELYQQPQRPEDQAAMIIEQARKADSGTIRMKRSLLMRVGEALAPDAFLLVLDSESDTKELSAGKGHVTQIRRLAGKAQQFKKCVRKAEGHLRRLGDENDRERARLWGDLAKTARKQEVWDVCRVASRFCLQYDDGRWKNEPLVKEGTTSRRGKSTDRDQAADGGETERDAADAPARERSTTRQSSRGEGGLLTNKSGVPLYDKDLIRMMAEVNYVNGEASIHLLRSQGVQLGDKPIPPTDKSKRPKGYVSKKPEEDPDWIEYCDWIHSLSTDATNSFLRAVDLGVDLRESWIVCSAATYVWNYNNHILTQDRHHEIIETLQSILAGLKKVGHAGETALLVNICTALAQGLMQPWSPQAQALEAVVPTPPPGEKSPREKSPKRRGPPPAASKSKVATSITISPDAMPDLKKGIEVCEYAMKITNGDKWSDVVPIGVRLPLLQTWVRSKQMAQIQISRAFGTDEDRTQEGQTPMTRAMVVVEMLSLNSNGIMEFKDTPSLPQVVEMLTHCQWTDHLVELQLWSRLAHLALEARDHKVVVTCAQSALHFAELGTQPKNKKAEAHRYIVEQEMLSFAACVYGQSLILNAQGSNSVRRNAMQQFLSSASFACNAKNYDLVMTAARHYWNACLPLIKQPIERELLKEPLTIMLEAIACTTDKSRFKKHDEEEEEEEEDAEAGLELAKKALVSGAVGVGESGDTVAKSQAGQIGGADDDLTLRASLYGVLFQSYADQGEWDAGLRAMEQAINDMPRTNHRLLIFKHLVMVKAKLGHSVDMSIQKFKDESEDYVAHMWRRVALCSKQQHEQLQAYQNSIEALTSASADWQKFDYLLEFGQWLYCNEFPLQDALDQIEWAVDILLNLQFEAEHTTSNKKDGKVSVAQAPPPPIMEEAAEAGSSGEEDEDAKAKKKAAAKKPGKTPPPPAQAPEKEKKADKKKKTAADKKGTAASAKGDTGDKKSGKGERKKDGEKEVDGDGEINVADYVPIKKDTIIGVLPVNPAMTLTDLTHILQLEGLFRSHMLLCQVSGRASPSHRDYCLTSYSYVIRMWQVALGHCGPVIKELAKNPPPVEDTGKKSQMGKKKEKDKEPQKEKPKRKGPLDTQPHSAEEWAAYDAPDEALEAFRQESMKHTGINSHTITKPTLTLLYLQQLVDELRVLGYNHLALPVLALTDLITRDIAKDRPLNALVHLRAAEVCLELNLAQGTAFHERLAEYKLNEEEQAKSHEELAMWKERQVQVKREERRLKESMARMLAESSNKSMSRDGEETRPSSKHIGRQIGALQIHETWMDTAEVLIQNGVYQPARALLNEAYQVVMAYEDKRQMARVLLLLGKLALQEAQYGQAVNFTQEAQKIHDGDEIFWFETTLVIVEATKRDYTLRTKDRLRKARGILIHTLHVFAEVCLMRPTKNALLSEIGARLNAELGSVQAEVALTEYEDLTKPKVLKAINSACKNLHTAVEQLLELGYLREAIPIMQQEGALLVRLARQLPLLEDKHDYYIQALAVLRESAAVAEEVMQDVHQLGALLELKSVSTPVQREVVAARLLCAELMLEMCEQYMKEERTHQLNDLRKGSVLRAVEELVRETPDYSPSERDWVDTVKVLGELTLVTACNAHSLAGALPELRARALLCVGTALRLLATHTNPDPPTHWNLQEMEVLQVAANIEKSVQLPGVMEEEGEGEGQTPRQLEEPLDKTSKQYIKYSKIMTTFKTSLNRSHQYLAHASEVLTQAVNLGLSKGITTVVSAAALELVECYGQYDPGLASHLLALHQSCQGAEYMRGLLHNALSDPSQSELAALIHQQRHLLSKDISSNTRRSTTYKAVIHELEETSLAWKRLAVQPQHVDLLKEFPPNFTFILLQHSPDKSKLYGSILDKPKSGGGGGKGSQKNVGLQATSKAKVIAMDTSPKELDELLTRFKWYKHDIMQTLIKFEYQRTQQAQREKMLANLDDTQKTGDEDSPSPTPHSSPATHKAKPSITNPFKDEWDADEQRLHAEFVSLLEVMENYLRPITTQLDVMLRPSSAESPTRNSSSASKTRVRTPRARKGSKPPSSSTVSNPNPGRAAKVEAPPQEYVVLLTDPWLMQLPLEALQCLQVESVVSLSRDISLQMLYHRIHVEPMDEAAEKAKKEKDKNKPPSRIPGLRDAAKKLSKIIPLDRPVPAGMLPMDTHQIRYVVDPFLDCSETVLTHQAAPPEEMKPIETLDAMVEEHSMQFTPRWLGVPGTEHPASIGEYEVYLNESSGFIFFGMERFLNYLPPHKVAALNLPDCQFAMLLDLTQTNQSFSRQSKTDVLKTATTLSLEKPVETSLLLSLSGINCVFSNQWHCTLKENGEKLNALAKDLLPKGKSTGESIRYNFVPQRRKDEEAAAAAAEAEEKGQGQAAAAEVKANDAGTEEETVPAPEPQEMQMTSSWYNMVCYGLPNLIMTQLSKP